MGELGERHLVLIALAAFFIGFLLLLLSVRANSAQHTPIGQLAAVAPGTLVEVQGVVAKVSNVGSGHSYYLCETECVSVLATGTGPTLSLIVPGDRLLAVGTLREYKGKLEIEVLEDSGLTLLPT